MSDLLDVVVMLPSSFRDRVGCDCYLKPILLKEGIQRLQWAESATRRDVEAGRLWSRFDPAEGHESTPLCQ